MNEKQPRKMTRNCRYCCKQHIQGRCGAQLIINGMESVENVIISLLRVCQNHARQVYKQNDDDEFEHLNIYILSMQYVCK